VLPDILVKGGDYEVEQIAGGQCVLENGGEVIILPFVEGFSTTNTLQKVIAAESAKLKQQKLNKSKKE
jgi:D-beta-D-heptose 7-phosphate kinase/D-beta-D-heptose 1-phosphate adenosyltransferase